MRRFPFEEGDFIRCLFPFSERPDEPAPEEHIAYCLGVFERKPGGGSAPNGLVVAVYTTTSLTPPNQPKPKGTAEFSAVQAAALGQRKAFLLDLRKVAFLPCTAGFFPALDPSDPDSAAGRLTVGQRAPERLRAEIRRLAREAHEHRLVLRVGPLRPR